MVKKDILLKSLPVLVIATIVGLGIASSYLQQRPTVPLAEAPAKKYKIAVMLPTTHPSLEAIQEGFLKTLKAQLTLDNQSFEHTIFNAQANRVLMKTQAHEIVTQHYDLVFTIGAATSLMAKETILQHKARLPLVFSAVRDTLGQELQAHPEQHTATITGITESPNYEEQLDLLKLLKPATQHIVVVYDPTQGGELEPELAKLRAACDRRSITVQPLAVNHMREIYQKTAAILESKADPTRDVVFVFKDNTVVSGIESLIQLCNRYHITLYTSDLESVDKGAALGYGIREEESGIQAAQRAYALLTQKQLNALSTPPCYVKVNTKTMQQQSLTINSLLLTLLARGETL
jgi:putative tryptophan/tyrosine transport system substrate-binding protein